MVCSKIKTKTYKKPSQNINLVFIRVFVTKKKTNIAAHCNIPEAFSVQATIISYRTAPAISLNDSSTYANYLSLYSSKIRKKKKIKSLPTRISKKLITVLRYEKISEKTYRRSCTAQTSPYSRSSRPPRASRSTERLL